MTRNDTRAIEKKNMASTTASRSASIPKMAPVKVKKSPAFIFRESFQKKYLPREDGYTYGATEPYRRF